MTSHSSYRSPFFCNLPSTFLFSFIVSFSLLFQKFATALVVHQVSTDPLEYRRTGNLLTSYLRHPHLVVVVVVVMALTMTLSAGFVLTTGRMAHLEVLGSLLTLLSRILLSSAMATWIVLKRLEPRSILETRFILETRSILETTFILALSSVLALSSTLEPRFIRDHIRNGTLWALACKGVFGLVSNSLFLTTGAEHLKFHGTQTAILILNVHNHKWLPRHRQQIKASARDINP